MKPIFPAALCLLLLLCACGQTSRPETNREELSVTARNDSLQIRRIVVPNDSGIVYLNFENGELKENIRKDSAQTVLVRFNPGDSTRLRGWLTSGDSLANIRFTQILMPDSTADGPFGWDITYPLSQRGTYSLIMGENMMAGDPWAGVFTIELKLSN